MFSVGEFESNIPILGNIDKAFQYPDEIVSPEVKRNVKLHKTIEKYGKCSKTTCLSLLYSLLPICQWLPKYNLHKLAKDVIPGLTIGVMQIPQGLAEANLAGVPPVYGLYSSFFPSFIYFFVGSSLLTSFGIHDVSHLLIAVSILFFTVVKTGTVFASLFVSFTVVTNETAVNDNTANPSPIEVATSLCLLVGIIQLVAGILHLGFFASYMSEPLMRAYATGCAFYVMVAQIPGSFGLTLQRRQGPLQIFYTLYDLFTHIRETDVATLITTIICVLAILITKGVLDPMIHKRLKVHIPIPIDLIVVILGTAISYLADFNKIWKMQIVGVIPTGFPTPVVPRVDLWPELIIDAFSIAIVSYCLSLSMAQILGKRNNYTVSANQECYADGLVQCTTSFVQCYSSSTSLSRSLVLDSIGAKTQITGLIGNTLVMVVILWLAPLLQTLPKCVLAAIILANLKRLLLQFSDLKILWKCSIIDFLIWIVTFTAVFIMNVSYGLFIGVAFAVLTVLLRSQWYSIVLKNFA